MEKGKVDMEQIRRYVRGELSPREMYTLERQAEGDPMLMDIIRGMEETPLDTHDRNLADIRGRLAARTGGEPTPVRRLAPAGRWAIAASILAVLSVGTWWFMRDGGVPEQRETQVAATPVPPPPAEARAGQETEALPPEAIAEAEPPAPETETAPGGRQPAGQREEQLALVAPAPVDARVADATTAFDLADSAPPLGYEGQPRLAAKAAAPPISGAVVRRSAVAARSLDTNKLTDSAEQDTSPQQAEITHNPNEPMPKDGWNVYWMYVRKAVKIAPEGEGTVDLTFRVAEDGRPADITVVKTSNETLNKFAELIVRDGPAWIPGKNGERKVTLTVMF